MRKSLSIVGAVLVLVSAVAADARAQPPVMAYAPPMTYGAWTHVRNHIGPATMTITVTPLGDTAVFGEIKYFDRTGHERIEPFFTVVTIRTCDCVAPVYVRLKGVPLGSACRVNVN
jgi:hypothetical protein